MTYLKAPLLPSCPALDCKAQHQKRCFILCCYQLSHYLPTNVPVTGTYMITGRLLQLLGLNIVNVIIAVKEWLVN